MRKLIKFFPLKIKKIVKSISYRKKNINYCSELEKFKKITKYGDFFVDFYDDYSQTKIYKVYENGFIDFNYCTLICVIKNDIIRLPQFINHYKSIGVKNFVFLDDKSNDGTTDYLKKLDNIIIFNSNRSYSTIIRQVWINKMIMELGINRWYLIVDSDELFVYDNYENISIDDFIKNNNSKLFKSIMLDMYPKNYNNDLTLDDFVYCDSQYRIDREWFFNRIVGGMRERIFADLKGAPCLCKYPLVYMDGSLLLCNSHYNYPFENNYGITVNTALLHYKFLPQDMEKIKERIINKNFAFGSAEYKKYYEKLSKGNISFICESSIIFSGSESLKKINIFGKKI